MGRGKRVERADFAPVLTNCSISLSYGGFVVLGAGFTLSTLLFVKEKYIQKRSINLLKHLHCLFFSFFWSCVCNMCFRKSIDSVFEEPS